MIRRRAKAGETIRLLTPNIDAIAHLPPGTLLMVHGYVSEQPSSCLVSVIDVPEAPSVYHVIVPKGAQVEVHEE